MLYTYLIFYSACVLCILHFEHLESIGNFLPGHYLSISFETLKHNAMHISKYG